MKNKCHKWVENIVRKGEIDCNKQFLLYSQCFPQLYIFSVSKWGIVTKLQTGPDWEYLDNKINIVQVIEFVIG